MQPFKPVPGQTREDAKAIVRDQAKQDRAAQVKADHDKINNPPLDPNSDEQAETDRAAERARLATEEREKAKREG